MSQLTLTGTGAAYVRVSTDKQETERQFASIRLFSERYKVKIPEQHWFEDRGWERDADRQRPQFNRLLELAEAGRIQWIVVDSLDRFGTKSAKRLMGYLADLEEAGCKLYTVDGKEWTGEDDATELTAWLGGRTSMKEQREKSKRTLGGMVERAKAGEWQGGAPKLGFDVACFYRASKAELWRVIWEGRDDTGRKEERRGKQRPIYHIRRLKVYPDGKAERFDGNVVFRLSKDTQVMRITPTKDAAKLAATKGVFDRYAKEAVSFFDLAKWLNGLGIRNSFGQKFQSNDVKKILSDEAYLGYVTFNKRRSGRFHRHDAEGGVKEVEQELRGRDTASEEADVIKSDRVFPPFIDRSTWDSVQRKLGGRERKTHAPRSSSLYFAGLVTCSGCGAPMIGRKDRAEYYCSTWDRHRTKGDLANSPCERNGVKQETLEHLVNQYLDEIGKRAQFLVRPASGSEGLTANLWAQEKEESASFSEGLYQLTCYLAEHHPTEYNAILREHTIPQEEGGPGPDDFYDAVIKCYRLRFDPSGIREEKARLDADHTKLTDQWADLPTPRAKEKARAKLAELEGRITELERQETDVSEAVEAHYRQMNDLQRAIADARIAMKSESGASALRQKTQTLCGLIQRIECEFVLTGKGLETKGGPGQSRTKLVAVVFHQIAGDARMISAGEEGAGANGGDREYGKP